MPGRAPAREHGRRRIAAPVAVVAVIVLAWALMSDQLERIAVVGPAEAPVAVLMPDEDPEPDGERLETCRRSEDPAAPCGPLLVDGLRSRGVVSALSSDAVVFGASGEVARVDLPTGEARWRTLAFAGARQLRLQGADERVLVTTVGSIAALDAMTGDVLWRRHLDVAAGDAAGATGAGGPAASAVAAAGGPGSAARAWLVDDDVLVLDHLGMMHALDGASGSPLWQQADVGREAIATPTGVVTAGWDRIAAWHPRGPSPLWERLDQGLRPRTVPHGTTVDGPLPLTPWRRLIDSDSGELLELPAQGPTSTYVSDQVTLILHWPGTGKGLEITALEAGANVRWQREGLPIPCCLASLVRATDGRIVVTAPSLPAVLLDLDDGATLATLERPSGRLEAVAGDLAWWRTSDGLIAEGLDGGPEVFHAVGTLLSLEPLVIDGPSGVVAVVGPGERIVEPSAR